MNKNQLKLLELSGRKNLLAMSLRSVGREVGIKNAATVKYHLNQLKNKGLLKAQTKKGAFSSLQKTVAKSQEFLVSIPILGAANCGVATLMAEETLEGYLRISAKLLPYDNSDGLFAIRAEGDSMDLANIQGKHIDDGDYLIVDTNKVNPENGDYVLSIIDGCANIKRFVNDRENKKIALLSESSKNYPPIYIHPEDDYMVNGLVIAVIKKP